MEQQAKPLLVIAIEAHEQAHAHIARAVELLQPVFAPQDVSGPSADARRAALCAALEENAKAEEQINAYLMNAINHGQQMRMNLHRHSAAIREQDEIIVAWEEGVRRKLAQIPPKATA
jgi:hypothetical protein